MVIILAAAQTAAPLVNLILLGALITLIVLPIQGWLRTQGLSFRGAYLVTLSIVLVVTVLILSLGGIALAQTVRDIHTYLDAFQGNSRVLGSNEYSAAANGIAQLALQALASLAASGIGFIVGAAFVLLLVAFMLAEAGTFVKLVRRTVGAENPPLHRLTHATRRVITYLSITAALNFFIAVGDVILLALVGVPNPILWGIIAFVFGFIPYIGYWVSFLPPFILAFSIGGIVPALVVLVGYALINGVFSQIVAPRMYGQGLNLSITLTFVAVLFWGWLLGPVGAIVGVPLTSILKEGLLASFPETEWLAKILGNPRLETASDTQNEASHTG